jgi:hypothetical protein
MTTNITNLIIRFFYASMLCVVALAGVAFSEDPPAKSPVLSDEDMRFFENKVRPLLAERCWSCHGEEKQKGSLRLDSLGAMLQGGESGPSLVPGKPDESLLIEAIRYQSFEMPPMKPLPESEIAILTNWVSKGALWPGSEFTSAKSRSQFDNEDRSWWAIQPIRECVIPSANIGTKSGNWARNHIDHFLLDRMQSPGLTPAEESDRFSLIRRLYFDVVGLPPTYKQVEAFVNNESPDAYEELVDALLNSPGYGENAARQWLDLVRYADSDGYRADGFRPNAWRYRDYVIKSFNDDKPYDRFVQEQIAGDELFPDDLEARVALGYLRHWVYEWNIRDAPGQWTTIVEDITDTTADVFMGLGLQCAKCHDHKFDPLLRKDYFRLRAFFAPIMPEESTIATPREIEEFVSEKKKWESKVTEFQSEIETIEAPYRDKLKNRAINRFPEDVQALVRKAAEEQSPYEKQLTHLVMLQVEAEYKGLEGELKADDKDRVLELRRKIESFDELRPMSLPVAITVSDVGPVAPPTFIPKRASENIEPGFPTILEESPATIEAIPEGTGTTGRRATLAKWLTRKDNPLTARVIVNRIWQSHFGRGLAANASDFGRLGEPPTHPELLDWMTGEFVKGGWSLKSLHRLILNSATYRQSTHHVSLSQFQTIDPANRYYWRSDTRRLSAEKIRDAILVTTGQLNNVNSGPALMPDVPCRTIFTRVMRNSPDELLDSFDLPLFFSSNSSRNTTTTPVQSLLLINSETMLAHARKLAQVVKAESSDLRLQLASAWRRIYGRPPSDLELKQSIEFIASQSEMIAAMQAQQDSQVIETAKLPYRTGQAVRFVAENSELKLSIPNAQGMDVCDFTVEAFFQLRSVDGSAAVRTVIGKWDGDRNHAGWGFGVTGHGSRRKPQTLVLQVVGEWLDGTKAEKPIFSDQYVEINKPYYVAASVRLAKDGKPGKVRFHLKDLSNDDEPLLTAEIEHDVVGGFANELPLTIGGLSGAKPRSFDGLVDDVRFVSTALSVDQLLYSAERSIPETIGYWQFESDPGVVRNSANDRNHIHAKGKSIVRLSVSEAALVDFCHSLLNSNGFLYVH